jgi:hypothetical protein
MSIKITDLKPTGSELFSDSETFMNELTGDKLIDIKGGLTSVSYTLSGWSVSGSKVSLTLVKPR